MCLYLLSLNCKVKFHTIYTCVHTHTHTHTHTLSLSERLDFLGLTAEASDTSVDLWIPFPGSLALRFMSHLVSSLTLKVIDLFILFLNPFPIVFSSLCQICELHSSSYPRNSIFIFKNFHRNWICSPNAYTVPWKVCESVSFFVSSPTLDLIHLCHLCCSGESQMDIIFHF